MASAEGYELGSLLERTRTGDGNAREDLFARLRPFLKALLRSWLGVDLARKLADSDIVQSALLKIHRDFDQCRGRSVPEFLGWARQVAVHTALDFRKRNRDGARDDNALLQQVADDAPPPLENVEKAEEVLRLSAALEKLPERRRDVVVARLFEGLSFEAIAGRDGTKAGALRVLFLRALRQLQQLMEADDASS